MAHELDFSTGRAAIALRGGARTAWHRFGEEILPSDGPEEIARKAGLAWTLSLRPVFFQDTDGTFKEITDQRATVRLDTRAALGIVSADRFHIDQPADVLEFFREELAAASLNIETAGALKGGRIVWALAKLGPDFRHLAPGGDRTDGYVRLQWGNDGSRTRSLVGTTIRQICANTERMIENATRARQYRMHHSRRADWRSLKAAFGLLGDQWRVTCDVWDKLSQREVSDAEAREFFCRAVGIEPAALNAVDGHGEPVVSKRTRNVLNALADAYRNGPGAQLASAKGTAYGLLNAVTYHVDHKATVRDTSGEGADAARLAASWVGQGAAVKERARTFAMELAGIKVAA